MKTIEIFNTIKNDYQTILGENLTGIYIHGSYAFGCFNERKSDLDFIVVVHSKLDAETKLALLDVLGNLHDTAPSKGLEMSVVLKKYCAHFQYPTPYELHFSNMWWAAYLSDPMKLCSDDLKTDRDLAGHFTVINHCGIVLCGEPIQSVFGEVKPEYYIRSIVNDVEDASSDIDEQPTYVILNLCRVWAYLADKKIVSKQQGGEWALQNIEHQWNQVVRIALRNYQIFGEEETITHKDKINFSVYMLGKINDLLETKD